MASRRWTPHDRDRPRAASLAPSVAQHHGRLLSEYEYEHRRKQIICAASRLPISAIAYTSPST